MNSKINLILVLTASFFGLILFQSNLIAQDILPSQPTKIQGIILPTPSNGCQLIDKIEEAKQLLENSSPLQFKEEPRKDKRGKIVKKKGQPVMEMIKKEISLAILDIKICQIFEKRYWLNMSEINKASDLRRKYLPNPDNLPIFRSDNPNEEFDVINNWWNSFNSDWSIAINRAVDNRYAVVADKYLMLNDDLAYPEDRKGQKYSDVVYVPYSPALKDKALITAGEKFLNDHVRDAFEELIVAGVRSIAFPDRLVADIMIQEFVKNIFLTEQTDPKMMILSTDGGKELVERVFIRLGANGEKAFRYTVSKTGASGLGQIMPKTYSNPNKDPNKRGALEKYPSAGLNKNVDIGRGDVKNGIKATALILEMKLSEIEAKVRTSSKAKKIWSSKTPEQKEEAIAASYNGGSSKYKYLTGNISTAVTETVLFVRKFRMIRDLNLFN